MNLDNFERQHKDVYEVMDDIEKMISTGVTEEGELARLINKLAGQLNIHLSSEDKFLYPSLLKDEKVSEMAKMYMDEMGGILGEFTEYKNLYNTKTKILKDKDSAIRETKAMLSKIRNRMNKEEKELYLLIK